MKNTLEETKKILLQHVDETELYIAGDNRLIHGQIDSGEDLYINFSYNDMIYEAIINVIYATAKIELSVLVCNRPNVTDFPTFIDMLIGIMSDYNNYKGKEFCMKLLLDL